MTSTIEDDIQTVLKNCRTIALVGASPKPERPSHEVMEYLLTQGYEVVPVNPGQAGGHILGQFVYAALADIPFPVDLVDVFRDSDATPEIVDQALAIHAKAVWLQLGVSNPLARGKAHAGKIMYIEDRCVKIEHAKLKAQLHAQ